MTSNDYPFWTYEELAEIAYHEAVEEYNRMLSSIDADDLQYPPVEYWDEVIAYSG
jgi:hypothetical protein